MSEMYIIGFAHSLIVGRGTTKPAAQSERAT
jgi:hypothetical protein